MRHTLAEDVQASISGTLLVALAVVFFQHASLLIGGVAGAAFLVHYATGWSFGAVFFVLNLPFYWFAWRRMGRAFTLRTFIAVGLLSVFSELAPRLVSFESVDPIYAGVMAGLLAGIGILIIFRHHASLGGVGIVAAWVQQRGILSAGRFQMIVDGAIMLIAFTMLEPSRVLISILASGVLNLMLAANHKPGRYTGY